MLLLISNIKLKQFNNLLKILPAFLILLAACQPGNEQTANNGDDIEDSQVSSPNTDASAEIDSSILYIFDLLIANIPAPTRFIKKFKEAGYSFNKFVIQDPDIVSSFISFDEQAIALGMYGTDLGYIALYEKHHLSDSYLQTIKRLSLNLRIGDIINEKFIELFNPKYFERSGLDIFRYINPFKFIKFS